MALSVGIIGSVIGYAFGALFAYVTMHLFAEREYGPSVASLARSLRSWDGPLVYSEDISPALSFIRTARRRTVRVAGDSVRFTSVDFTLKSMTRSRLSTDV